jgi:sirohydrochlorin ferrochelatase
MTEPDEAKQYAQSRIHGAGRAAWMAAPIKDELAMAYRAGQAASAERIKALGAGVSDAIAYVEFQRPNAIDLDQLLRALRALLEEAAQ